MNTETDLIVEQIQNDPSIKEDVERLVNGDRDCSDRVAGQKVKKYIESLPDFIMALESPGVAADLLRNALIEVDWTEIVARGRRPE